MAEKAREERQIKQRPLGLDSLDSQSCEDRLRCFVSPLRTQKTRILSQ